MTNLTFQGLYDGLALKLKDFKKVLPVELLKSHINRAYVTMCRDANWGRKVHTWSSVANQAEYEFATVLPSDTVVMKILSVVYDGDPLVLVSKDWMDTYRSNWRTWAAGTPIFVIPDVASGKITLAPKPESAGTDNMEMWYLPHPGELSDTTDKPIIPFDESPHIIDGATWLITGDTDAFQKYAMSIQRLKKRIEDEDIRRLGGITLRLPYQVRKYWKRYPEDYWGQ